MKKRFSIVITLIVILLFSMSVSSLAAPTTLTTDPFSAQEKATFAEDTDLKKVKKVTRTKPFDCFDVNEKGEIAVLFTGSPEYAICVYNSDFKLKYAFTFKAEGVVACEWSGDDIMVYFSSDDVYAKINKKGKWTMLSHVQDSVNNVKATSELVYKNSSITIGDTTYKAQNDLGLLNSFQPTRSYSQLVKLDENGNEAILFDVGSTQVLRTNLTVLFVILLALGALYNLLKELSKKAKKKELE